VNNGEPPVKRARDEIEAQSDVGVAWEFPALDCTHGGVHVGVDILGQPLRRPTTDLRQMHFTRNCAAKLTCGRMCRPTTCSCRLRSVWQLGGALASSGRLSDAIATVRAAAQDARDRTQPTHELACLPVAAQWGDASGAVRAGQLADMLSLRLANAVARHTESLLSGDGEGLLAASADYRAIGDRATGPMPPPKRLSYLAVRSCANADFMPRRLQGNRPRNVVGCARRRCVLRWEFRSLVGSVRSSSSLLPACPTARCRSARHVGAHR
jgi:hypothetical protein